MVLRLMKTILCMLLCIEFYPQLDKGTVYYFGTGGRVTLLPYPSFTPLKGDVHNSDLNLNKKSESE